jgi:diguanylate cyclase (GGDEF)-like protein/PAS domain S-box-containing protein
MAVPTAPASLCFAPLYAQTLVALNTRLEGCEWPRFQLTIPVMATPISKATIAPLVKQANLGVAVGPCELMSLNLPENSDSVQQQEVLDALPVLVFLERAGNVVFANAEARQTLGVAEGVWVERPVEDVLWGLFPGTAEPQTHLIGTRSGSPFHATMPARSGRLLPVEGTYSILNTELREAIIVAHPSGRVKAPKSRLMEDVLASIPEAVVIVHSNHVLYTNPAFTRMFGYTAEEASGGNLRELIVPETRQHELAMLEKEVDVKGRVTIDTVRMTKDGDLVDVALLSAPLRVDGSSVGYVLSFRDISERKQLETRVQMDAMFDVLTGLANRALFQDRVTLALKRRTRRKDQNCGILLLDLDRFEEINKELGHAAGDGLLMGVAERLKASLRPEDSASRLDRDEFAVLVENAMDPEDLEAVGSRILAKMEEPFEVFGRFVRASVSMGMVMAGPQHTIADLLLRDAGFALNRARMNGGGRSEVFNGQLEMPFKKCQKDPERELRRVLDRHQYEVWYQPIYQLKSGKLEGFESLLRLRRPDGSVDSFLEMLGVAENTGLSVTLGRETMEAVCRQLQTWSDGETQRELTISLNLSERQFFHPEMVPQLKKALDASMVNPARLLFEVTEGTLNQNPEAAAVILQRMAECKVRIALDNFGARLGSLNHLARLPIDVVKTSRKLTAKATEPGRQAAVLESLVRLGHALEMRVVAQGIETQEQLDAVLRLGCELGQGHLFSYALEPSRASKLAGLGRWALAAGA